MRAFPKPSECRYKRRVGKHMNKKATSARRKLEVYCRGLVAKLVMHRDQHTCQKCGRSAAQGFKIDAAHIKPKGRYPLLQFELVNIIALCYLCHNDWWHGSSEGLPWFKETYPDRWLQIEIAERNCRRTDLKELAIVLEAAVAGLERCEAGEREK